MRHTIALILILATEATAQAGWFNHLGRHLGLGWSDGYHAAGQSGHQPFSSFAIPPGGLAVPQQSVAPNRQVQPTPAMAPETLPAPTGALRRPSSEPLFELPN